jgi:hypothetical protein
MIMSLFKTLRWVICVCAFAGVIAPTSAHVLNETTAQVILRDGQVEVKVITATDHLVEALQNDQAWLLGDIDMIMPAGLTLKQQGEFIEKALQQKTSLTVNQQVIRFERVTFSSNPMTRVGELMLQAKHVFPEVKDLSISFHKALGPVHMSVVKPQYKLLSAGESAKISF